jgi:hypothetical protein
MATSGGKPALGTAARGVGQPLQTLRQESFGPLAHDPALEADQLSHLGLGVPISQQQDNLPPACQAGGHGGRPLPALQGLALCGGQENNQRRFAAACHGSFLLTVLFRHQQGYRHALTKSSEFAHLFMTSCTKERFESLYTRRPVVLKGLRLQGHSPGREGPFPLEGALRQALENQWVPLLIVRPQDEGRLRALLHGRDIILRYIDVSFADGTTTYPAIVGTAAFIVHAELERYLRYREKLDDNTPYIVG